MVIEETLKIKAPIQKIWETMIDVQFLRSSVPAMEDIQTVDGHAYKAVLKDKVSFIPVIFDVAITVLNQQEPAHIEVKGDGKGRKGLGRVTFSHTVDLKSVSPEETEVAYKLVLNVVGRLATLGGKAISKKINEASAAFRRSFIAKCEG